MGQICDRCVNQNLNCSYVTPPGAFHQTNTVTAKSPGRQNLPVPRDYFQYPEQEPFHGLENDIDEGSFSYDIGNGTPAEILREADLTRDLLLLYFSNFSDVHFMFDKSSFLRQVALGEIPKAILYAMMALGIKCVVLANLYYCSSTNVNRYSNSPVFSHVPRCNRGEPIFREARKLLETDFDDTSVRSIQTYILLSTYCLTFGVVRKAWFYLGV